MNKNFEFEETWVDDRPSENNRAPNICQIGKKNKWITILSILFGVSISISICISIFNKLNNFYNTPIGDMKYNKCIPGSSENIVDHLYTKVENNIGQRSLVFIDDRNITKKTLDSLNLLYSSNKFFIIYSSMSVKDIYKKVNNVSVYNALEDKINSNSMVDKYSNSGILSSRLKHYPYYITNEPKN